MGDLTENKPFEVEVRFTIPDITHFKQVVSDLGCELVTEYAFTDHYYKPIKGEWNSLEKTIRIREWRKPSKSTVIYLAKEEIKESGSYFFKRSAYTEGKLSVLSGSIETCRTVLSDLGFQHAYSIEKKQGWVWKNSRYDLEFCAEETDLLGWSGEMEIDGTDFSYIEERIERHKHHLQLTDDQLSYKPMAVMIEERLAHNVYETKHD